MTLLKCELLGIALNTMTCPSPQAVPSIATRRPEGNDLALSVHFIVPVRSPESTSIEHIVCFQTVSPKEVALLIRQNVSHASRSPWDIYALQRFVRMRELE